MSLIEGNLKRIQESLNDILECSVCRDVFEDARMLPCIHSFCLKCLKEMLSRCTGNAITCPMCRSEFPMPENGVEGLHKNFFVMRLQETMQIVNSTTAVNSSCDICREDSATGGAPPNAEMYCTDCKERLCSKCCIIHIRNVSNRKHTLIAISDNSERKIELEPGTSIYCDIHKQHPIDLYCLKCMQVLCAMCYIEKHLNHERKPITDASQMFRYQIEQSIARLSPDKDILLKKKDEFENGKSAILLETAQLEKAIIDIRDTIVKRADDDAKSLLFMLSMKTKEKLKDTEILMSDVMFKYSCLDSYLNYCNGLSMEGSDIDICHAAHCLETRSKELQRSATVNLLSSEVRFQMELKKTDLETFLAQSNVIGELNDVQDSNKLQKFKENENVTEVKNMDTLEVKQQLCEPCQPHVQASDTKDTGENNSGTSIQNDNEDSTTSESEGSDVNSADFHSSTEEALIQSLESNLERSDDGLVPAKTESLRSSLFSWMFARSNSGGDISETESFNGERRSRQSSESEDNCFDPLWIHTIKTKSSANDSQPISGITVLYQELYVVSDASSTVEVYDTTTFALLRELRIPRLVDPGDIASCPNNSCIYIIDWKSRDQSNEVLKVNAAGTLMKKWRTPNDYSWLSVTHESHIVVTLHEENTINEYKPSGSLIRSVKIPPSSGVHHLWHAIKLTNGNFVISHGLKNCHRVCQVDVNGTVTNSFGENLGVQRLRSAVYLAEDSYGSILVVDQCRGRVVQLHSHLEFQKQLFTRKHNLYSPIRIHLDSSNRKLFVADRKCLISVFNFC